MGNLSMFVPDDQDVMAGVFYKIGVWISHIDDDGECTADAEEEKVLMEVLESLSKTYKDTQLIAQMTAEAARQTSNHDRWLGDADNAIDEAVKVARFIKVQMSNEDLAAFKSASSEIARAVATAFREGDDESQDKGAKLRKFLVKLTNKELYEERNISPAEDMALNELSMALQDV